MSRPGVLVTGGSGLIGSAIREQLAEQAVSSNSFEFPLQSGKFRFKFLSSKDADLTDFQAASRIFEEFKPNYVINLAARVGGLYANMSNNETFYRQNAKINENVLELSRALKVNKCLSCLSTCIFPAQVGEFPIDETMIHSGPPHCSNVGYSIAKRQVDLLNTLYNGLEQNEQLHKQNKHQPSSLFTSFIPTNVYGCHDNFEQTQSHVIPGLIYKAHQCVLNGDQILPVLGSGLPLRQFIFAPDLAKLILWCLEHYHQPTPLILCPDVCEEITIKRVAEIIAEIFAEKYKVNLGVEFDLSKSDGQMRKTATNSKFRKLYPNFQFTPLEVGLKKVIDWYCESYPNVRK